MLLDLVLGVLLAELNCYLFFVMITTGEAPELTKGSTIQTSYIAINFFPNLSCKDCGLM